MPAPIEIPYVVPSDASDRCRDLVIGIVAALGQPNQDVVELHDRLVAIVTVLAAEIARGGDHETARARYSMAGKLLSDLGPECVERARQLREADKSVN